MEVLLLVGLIIAVVLVINVFSQDGTGNPPLDQSWQKDKRRRGSSDWRSRKIPPKTHSVSPKQAPTPSRPAPQRPAPYDPGLGDRRTLRGRAWVIDGDTIAIDRIKIRLAGIDAPELDEPWGQKSKYAMIRLCKGHIVTAKLTGEVSYDRVVGTCYLDDGRDLGAELIKAGLALDFAHFSGGKYRHLETTELRRKLQFIRRKIEHSKVLD